MRISGLFVKLSELPLDESTNFLIIFSHKHCSRRFFKKCKPTNQPTNQLLTNFLVSYLWVQLTANCVFVEEILFALLNNPIVETTEGKICYKRKWGLCAISHIWHYSYRCDDGLIAFESFESLCILLMPKNALHLKKYRGHTFTYILLTMQDFYFFNILFISAVLGLHCCAGFL